MTPLRNPESRILESQDSVSQAEALRATASAAMVNRTHRVIRERAQNLQARRKAVRSLWIPVAISSGLVAILSFAIWSLLAEYDVIPTETPDASQQIFVLLLWCLPLTAAILAVVWFRRSMEGSSGEGSGAEGGAR